jgi:hypothetical protein
MKLFSKEWINHKWDKRAEYLFFGSCIATNIVMVHSGVGDKLPIYYALMIVISIIAAIIPNMRDDTTEDDWIE